MPKVSVWSRTVHSHLLLWIHWPIAKVALYQRYWVKHYTQTSTTCRLRPFTGQVAWGQRGVWKVLVLNVAASTRVSWDCTVHQWVAWAYSDGARVKCGLLPYNIHQLSSTCWMAANRNACMQVSMHAVSTGTAHFCRLSWSVANDLINSHATSPSVQCVAWGVVTTSKNDVTLCSSTKYPQINGSKQNGCGKQVDVNNVHTRVSFVLAAVPWWRRKHLTMMMKFASSRKSMFSHTVLCKCK
jgi:hypothetical protein